MEDLTRRAMFRFLGAAGAWTLAGCGKYPGPSQVSPLPAGWSPGEERWIPSTCLQCPGGCGIRVRVFEGRAVKIEGNPKHPLNRGGLCPKGQAGLQVLYDPDRIPGPMRKVGGRSSARWEAISWDEAIRLVASRLRELRQNGKSHTVLFCGGRFPGHMKDLFERWARAYGSPNLVDSESACTRALRLSMFMQQGVFERPGFDLQNTRFLMVFGAGFLEAWPPTTYSLRAYGAMRQGRPAERSKIVVVDPRCSVGASKADEWIPVVPGTDAALALGMAHVILKHELFERRFIGQHAFGFEDWEEKGGNQRDGFRNVVLREYPPERVEKITGVPAGTIERLAREFAQTRPAIAIVGRGVGGRTDGLSAIMAIHALNALSGSINVPGGVIVQEHPPFHAWSEAVLDDVAQNGIKRLPLGLTSLPSNGLPGWSGDYPALVDSLLRGSPYPAEAALVYYTNPLFSAPESNLYRQAFDRIPFVVSFSPFMDETTARADLVLPDGTYLERLEDSYILPSVGFPVLNLRQPVVRPFHDVRHTGDVLLELARQVGGTVSDSFPWKNYEQAIKEAAAGLVNVPGSFQAKDIDEFWTKLKEQGFWSGTGYQFDNLKRALRTPTGKFEFFSTAFQHHTEEATGTRSNKSGVRGILRNAAFTPHDQTGTRAAEEGRFPFHLVTYKSMMHAEGRGGNQPWLQECFGVQLTERWAPWVEVNPGVAERLGIRDGEKVWVESEVGRLKLRVRLHPGVRPDIVCVPFEYGHTNYGRWASRIEGNPNIITASGFDEVTGVHSILATLVRIYPALDGPGTEKKIVERNQL